MTTFYAVPCRRLGVKNYIDLADVDLAEEASTEDDAVIMVSEHIDFDVHSGIIVTNMQTYAQQEYEFKGD